MQAWVGCWHLLPLCGSAGEPDHTVTTRRWHGRDRGVSRLGDLGTLQGHHFELHAGANYLEFGLMDSLIRHGATVSWPTRGLPMGKQLQFYQRRHKA